MSRNLVLVCSGLVSAAALFYVLSSKKTYDKDLESMRLKEELIALKERIHKRRIFFLKTASAMTVGIIIYVNAKALYKRFKSGHHHHHHHPCRDWSTYPTYRSRTVSFSVFFCFPSRIPLSLKRVCLEQNVFSQIEERRNPSQSNFTILQYHGCLLKFYNRNKDRSNDFTTRSSVAEFKDIWFSTFGQHVSLFICSRTTYIFFHDYRRISAVCCRYASLSKWMMSSEQLLN